MKVPYGYMCKLAYIESGFNPYAQNPRSSARGLYQIIESTERSLRAKYKIRGDIFDPETNTTMAAYLVKEYMKSGVKSYTSLYLMHFLGKKTYEKFADLPDHAIIKEVLPRVYYFNKRMVGNKTKIQFIQLIESKLDKVKGCE
jgi:soluble lytic murein transglycosylase-like protein